MEELMMTCLSRLLLRKLVGAPSRTALRGDLRQRLPLASKQVSLPFTHWEGPSGQETVVTHTRSSAGRDSVGSVYHPFLSSAPVPPSLATLLTSLVL